MEQELNEIREDVRRLAKVVEDSFDENREEQEKAEEYFKRIEKTLQRMNDRIQNIERRIEK